MMPVPGEMWIYNAKTMTQLQVGLWTNKNYKMRSNINVFQIKVSSNSMQLSTLQEEEQTAMH
jgi:hypothetical protein